MKRLLVALAAIPLLSIPGTAGAVGMGGSVTAGYTVPYGGPPCTGILIYDYDGFRVTSYLWRGYC